MKTFKEIKQSVRRGDYLTAAEIIGISAELVRHVVNGIREDHHNIQKTLSELIEQREKLTVRTRKRTRKAVA